MKQYRFSVEDFVPPGEQGHEDAVLDPNDPIYEMKRLAGIPSSNQMQEYRGFAGSNISVTGNEKGELMKRHDIRPGTEEWFRHWFSVPFWFKETPNR
jgi:hypothetical protein